MASNFLDGIEEALVSNYENQLKKAHDQFRREEKGRDLGDYPSHILGAAFLSLIPVCLHLSNNLEKVHGLLAISELYEAPSDVLQKCMITEIEAAHNLLQVSIGFLEEHCVMAKKTLEESKKRQEANKGN